MQAVTSACKVLLETDKEGRFLERNGTRRRKVPEGREEVQEEDQDFSEADFVNKLLNEGLHVPCDATSTSFCLNEQLPNYYDEDLYKKGQNFFYKHIFGLFFSKLLGLILVLTLPAVRILIMTSRSSTPMTSYRRYMATIFHMCMWYDCDFKEGSKLWSSIRTVKSMHNAASNQSSQKLSYRINQRDMALTQFGFMGFGVARSEMVGVHNATDEELKGFIHVWRVVGYLLGLEDRFNICRPSVKETRNICNLIIEKVYKPYLEHPTEGFEDMSKVLIEGMWVMNPFLQYDVFMCYLHMILENTNYLNLSNESVKNLSRRGRSKLNAMVLILKALQLAPVRIFYKYLQIFTLWLMRTFPFLAYRQFGRQNALVTI